MRLRYSRFPSSGRINKLEEKENSQIRNVVSLKKPSKEVTKELKTVDQKQFTPKNEEHKEEFTLKNANHKEDVDSLPTEKTNEALQQNSSKEGVEIIEATKKSDLRKVDQKQFTPKNEEHKEEFTLKNENHKEDVDSLPTKKPNKALQQNSSKEGVEIIEATKKSDLRKVDQKHFTLKNEEHKEESTLKNENHKEDVNSLPTKKRKNQKEGRSPIDLHTKEAPLKDPFKEGIEKKEAVKKSDLQIEDLTQVTHKKDEYGKKTIVRHKEEVNSL